MQRRGAAAGLRIDPGEVSMNASADGGLKRHFTYANVMSTLAVFLVIAGGTAMAAAVNSSKDIAKQAIKNSDVKKESLTSNRLKDGAAVASSDVIDDSLSGADINESNAQPGPADRRCRRRPHRHLPEPDDRRRQGDLGEGGRQHAHRWRHR